MAASLSDCAAMATTCCGRCFCGLPKNYGSMELKEIHRGVIPAGDKYGCALVGGDITKWQSDGKLVVNVAMISVCAGNKPLRRSGRRSETLFVLQAHWRLCSREHLKFEAASI